MMYGTRKELNKKLKRMFGNDECFALLLWTKEEVMAQAENMTEREADAILQEIGRAGTGDHTEEGISYRTVQALYAGLRPHQALLIWCCELSIIIVENAAVHPAP